MFNLLELDPSDPEVRNQYMPDGLHPNADITSSGLRTFANPAVGVDIGRFSFKVGYEYQLGCWGNGDGVHTHQVKCGVGFTF